MNLIGARSRRRALAVSAAVAVIVFATSQAWSISTRVGSDFTETVNPNCEAALICRFVFSATGANTEKLITHVSCEVKALNTNNAQMYESSLGRGTGPLQMPYTSLVPVVVATFPAGTRFFKINNSAYHVFSAAQVPQVFLRLNGGTFSYAACTISGVIKDLTP